MTQEGEVVQDLTFLIAAGESINAKAFVMLEEEELKELGVSFGGRMVLMQPSTILEYIHVQHCYMPPLTSA